MLSPDERRWVDDYHAEVLRIVGPQLDGEARAWLEARLRAARSRTEWPAEAGGRS